MSEAKARGWDEAIDALSQAASLWVLEHLVFNSTQLMERLIESSEPQIGREEVVQRWCEALLLTSLAGNRQLLLITGEELRRIAEESGAEIDERNEEERPVWHIRDLRTRRQEQLKLHNMLLDSYLADREAPELGLSSSAQQLAARSAQAIEQVLHAGATIPIEALRQAGREFAEANRSLAVQRAMLSVLSVSGLLEQPGGAEQAAQLIADETGQEFSIRRLGSQEWHTAKPSSAAGNKAES